MNGESDRKAYEFLVEPLSEREIQILELIADNLSKREIAVRLSLAYSTVKWYTQQTYRKLAVNSRRQAILRARELGFLELSRGESTLRKRLTTQANNPYKGLFAFQEEDAGNFYGREKLIERLVARLKDGGVSHFLAVVGPSGSGKSSLVKAGLIPALWQGRVKNAKSWTIAQMIPGKRPFDAFAASLASVNGDRPGREINPLRWDEGSILQSVRQVLQPGDRELLLVIDQFEEVFTLVEDATETRTFLESLCTAVTEVGSPLRVVIILRSDFFDRVLKDTVLSRLVQDRTEVVIPMTAEEMERAIRAPAEQTGLRVESGLVTTMVADMVEQPGALPLLQYALTEIFERRNADQLTLEGYQAIGGVRGVLERRAEETFAGLTSPGKSAASHVFLRLVTLGEGISSDGSSVPDTRRRVLIDELEAIVLPSHASPSGTIDQEIDSRAVIAEVLNAFGKARLLYFDRDASTHSATVEVAHEALLSEWRRLRGWLDQEREDVRMQRTLGRIAADWIRSGQEASFLLHGTQLTLFENWATNTKLALTKEEDFFLKASLAERSAQQKAEAARKERETTLDRRARAAELAMLAINNLQTDPERSIFLALQAIHTENIQAAVDALHQAVQSSRVRKTLMGFEGGACSVDFSPDGKQIAIASCAGEATIWDTEKWQKLFSQPGKFVKYSPDGSVLAVGCEDGTVMLLDPITHQEVFTLRGHHQSIYQLNFSRNGKLLISTSIDQTLIVWDVKRGERLFSTNSDFQASFSPDSKLMITADEAGLTNLLRIRETNHPWAILDQLHGYANPIISPDGRWLISSGGGVLDNGITLWDLSNADLGSTGFSTIKPLLLSAAHTNTVLHFAFNASSSMLASVSQDGTAKIWGPSNTGLTLLMTLSGHTGSIPGVTFSPDGSVLATAGQDGTVRIWDVTPAGASEWFALTGEGNNRYRMSLSKNGRYLGTGSYDGASADVWDLQAGKKVLAINNHGAPIFTVGISPDGSLLATAGYDNLAKIWELDLSTGTHSTEPVLTLDGQATGPRVGGLFSGLTAAVFSMDGARIATGGVDGMARIWEIRSGKQLLQVQVHPDHRGATSLTFSPDNRFLATASDGPDPVAKIWDASTGREVSLFSGLREIDRIWGLAFSPDGKRVATSGQGGRVKVWEAKTGKELVTFVGHTSTVVGITFSPDGKYIATASADGTARVWDSFSGKMIQIFNSPRGALINIAFTPDGKRLVTSGAGYIYGFIFDQDELIQLAESRLTRRFTPDERQQFLRQEKQYLR